MRHLLLPGLSDAPPHALDDSVPVLTPSLDRVLARADRTPGPNSFAAAAFRLFGLTPSIDEDLPTAALQLSAIVGEAPVATAYWLQADPVLLGADQDRLLLFAAVGDLSMEQSRALVDSFNRHFAADGLELIAPRADHWFLRLDAPSGVATSDIDEVIGRDLYAHLPRGPRERYWRQLLNETQMLFFDHPANQAREAAGQLAVSGLWFSGGGFLPEAESTQIGSVSGERHPLIDALQRRTTVAGNDELELIWRLHAAQVTADAAAWLDALAFTEQRIAALVRANEAFHLYDCCGQVWHWQPAMRWRYWRKTRSALSRMRKAPH